MLASRLLLTLGAALLGGCIAWASMSAPFWESFSAITAMPWGVVTLVDLYLGFFCAAFLVLRVETNRLSAVTVIALILVLGNVVTALWLAARGLPWLARRAMPAS